MDVKIDDSKMNLETSRLLLRPFCESDLADLYAYASVPGVGEMAGWPHHESIEASEGILRSFINDFLKKHRKNLNRDWEKEEASYIRRE